MRSFRHVASAACIAAVIGCGPSVRTGDDSSAADGSGGSGIDPEAGTDASSTSVASGGLEGGAPVDASGDPTTPKLDLGTPSWDPVACARSAPVLDIMQATTPVGELVPDRAFVTDDWCSGDLLFVITQQRRTWHLAWTIPRDDPAATLYKGTYDVQAFEPNIEDLPAAIEFIEPWDPLTANDAAAMPLIHARLEAHANGWDFSAEVTLPFCAGGYDCYCPCE